MFLSSHSRGSFSSGGLGGIGGNGAAGSTGGDGGGYSGDIDGVHAVGGGSSKSGNNKDEVAGVRTGNGHVTISW